MKKKTLITILQYIFFLGLGVGLIYWQAQQFTPEQKQQIFDAVNKVRERAWLLIPIIVVGFLSELARSLRWKLLLQPLDVKPSVVNITGAVMIGYLANLLLPRMGEIARCSILARSEHTHVDKIIGSVVAERTFDLLCLVAITLLTVVLQMDVFGHYIRTQFGKVAINTTHIIIGIAVLVLLIAAAVFIIRRFRGSKVAGFIKGLAEGIQAIFRIQHRWLFLVYTAFIWFSYLLLVYIGFKGLSATDQLPFTSSLAVLILGSIGMIITPGGLGAYPAAVRLVLVKLYAIDSIFALAYGWVSWMAQTFIIIIFGLVSLLILPAYNRYYHGKTTVDKS